jgi:hypothetical protein
MSGHGDCYCHTCERDFDSMGIARHRAMHRDKKEDCKITFTKGDTWFYDFSNR